MHGPAGGLGRKRSVKRWHRKGFEVYTWTVNEKEEMRRVIDAGVDGIISDHPDVLKTMLE